MKLDDNQIIIPEIKINIEIDSQFKKDFSINQDIVIHKRFYFSPEKKSMGVII